MKRARIAALLWRGTVMDGRSCVYLACPPEAERWVSTSRLGGELVLESRSISYQTRARRLDILFKHNHREPQGVAYVANLLFQVLRAMKCRGWPARLSIMPHKHREPKSLLCDDPRCPHHSVRARVRHVVTRRL